MPRVKYAKPEVLLGHGCHLVRVGDDMTPYFTEYGMKEAKKEGWITNNNKHITNNK